MPTPSLHDILRGIIVRVVYSVQLVPVAGLYRPVGSKPVVGIEPFPASGRVHDMEFISMSLAALSFSGLSPEEYAVDASCNADD